MGVLCVVTSTRFLSVQSCVLKVGRGIEGHLKTCHQCRDARFDEQKYSQLVSSLLRHPMLVEFAPCHVFSQDFQDQAIPGQGTKGELSYSPVDSNENW